LDGRKNNKGTKGNKGGRKPKSEEQQLIERLTPMADTAHEQLKKAIDDGEQWAVRLWFEYFYGKPHQSQSLTVDNKTQVVELTKEQFNEAMDEITPK
jgi:hypothetical protein